MITLQITQNHLEKATWDYIDEEYDTLTGLVFDPIKYAYEDYLTSDKCKGIVHVFYAHTFESNKESFTNVPSVKLIKLQVISIENPLESCSIQYLLPSQYKKLHDLGKHKEDLISELEKTEYLVTIYDYRLEKFKQFVEG